jgi:hypothetical protein
MLKYNYLFFSFFVNINIISITSLFANIFIISLWINYLIFEFNNLIKNILLFMNFKLP